MVWSKVLTAFDSMEYDVKSADRSSEHKKGNQYKAVVISINDRRKFAETLLRNVKDKKTELSKMESEFSFQPQNDVLKEIDLALEFMGYYLTLSVPETSEAEVTVQVTTYTPVFEVIVELFTLILRGFKKITWKYSENQEHLVKRMLDGLTVEYIGFVEKSFKPSKLSYSSMIITESSDLESATDNLAKSWNNIYLPWTVRNLLVQESIYPKFLSMIKPKLKPFNENYLKNDDLTNKISMCLEKMRKMGLTLIHNESDANPITPTIVHNVTREFFEEVEFLIPIVNLNVFRTAKEAASLTNVCSGGSASVWCENISMALELAHSLKCQNVWINSNGLFSPRFPFKFEEKIYGSLAAFTHQAQVNSEFIGKTHFQTILDSDGKSFKTIVIPFGSTFAN